MSHVIPKEDGYYWFKSGMDDWQVVDINRGWVYLLNGGHPLEQSDLRESIDQFGPRIDREAVTLPRLSGIIDASISGDEIDERIAHRLAVNNTDTYLALTLPKDWRDRVDAQSIGPYWAADTKRVIDELLKENGNPTH